MVEPIQQGMHDAGASTLVRPVDRRKDQTYFLFELSQAQLEAALGFSGS